MWRKCLSPENTLYLIISTLAETESNMNSRRSLSAGWIRRAGEAGAADTPPCQREEEEREKPVMGLNPILHVEKKINYSDSLSALTPALTPVLTPVLTVRHVVYDWCLFVIKWHEFKSRFKSDFSTAFKRIITSEFQCHRRSCCGKKTFPLLTGFWLTVRVREAWPLTFEPF